MEYDSEALWSYEIGIKTQLFDNRLILNGAVFYMNIDEMQMHLTRQLTLTGNPGCARTEFDEFQDFKGNYDGNRALYAPEYTFSIGGHYRTDKGVYAVADLLGYGRMYLDNANKYPRDAYRLVNAKVGRESEN